MGHPGRPLRALVAGKLRCPHCKLWKPLAAYYRNCNLTHEKASWCKVCMNELKCRTAKRDAEAHRLRSARWRREHADYYRDYQRNYHRLWAKRNPDKLRQYAQTSRRKRTEESPDA